jgi:hypothetical protein
MEAAPMTPTKLLAAALLVPVLVLGVLTVAVVGIAHCLA